MHQSIKLFLPALVMGSCLSCNPSTERKTGFNQVATAIQKTTPSFSGTFFGVTPCADCPGIEATAIFNTDSSFSETSVYQERSTSFSDSGTWSLKDRLITVSYDQRSVKRYFQILSDTVIAMLDGNQQRIEGPLSVHYMLKKKMPSPASAGK